MNTIALEGRVTIDNSNDVRSELANALRSKPEILTVDLSRVTFIDSSGLATFVEAMRSARLQGGRLVFRGIQGQARYIFEVFQLNRLFEIDEETAA